MVEDKAYQATPDLILERQIMDSNVPKNEREWWARNEIERLREALEYCACTCAKSCGKHIEHDGEIAFVECSGWVARSALQQKGTE